MGLSFVTDWSARDRSVDLVVLIIQQHTEASGESRVVKIVVGDR